MACGTVEELSERSAVVAVPVYFSVAFDGDGNVCGVEGGGRRWVKGGRNKSGRAYGNAPTGQLERAARLARIAHSKARQAPDDR